MTYYRDLSQYPDLRNISEHGFDFAFKLQDFIGTDYGLDEWFDITVT